MKIRLIIRWLLILGLASIVCLYIFRPLYLLYWSGNIDEAQNKCLLQGKPGDPRSVPRGSDNSGSVKIIQLNDLGEFTNRCQITDALYELNWDRELSGPRDFNVAVKPGAIPKPKFVILYIHGWHNNAREDDGDLPNFRELSKRLAASNPEKQVTGIYVSWEANSDIPIWHYLDFWNRMRAADRIAQSGNVTNIIGAVGSIVAHAKVGGQFIAIGHSFGARILMASTLQSTIVAVQQAHPGRPGAMYKKIEGQAQPIIFLNPAFEASFFTTLSSFDRREESFSSDQKPVVISIATDNDYATTYAFPIGQWLAWWTAEKEIQTLGNYAPFRTHELKEMGSEGCQTSGGDVGLTESFNVSGLCLRRTAGGPHNPFMVVRTTADIVSGHSGIWSEKFSNWLFNYINELGKQLPRSQ